MLNTWNVLENIKGGQVEKVESSRMNTWSTSKIAAECSYNYYPFALWKRQDICLPPPLQANDSVDQFGIHLEILARLEFQYRMQIEGRPKSFSRLFNLQSSLFGFPS